MSNQNNAKSAADRRWGIIACAALVVTLFTGPLAGYAASAARDDGGFQVRAADQDGFVGQAGMRIRESSAGPVVETPPEPTSRVEIAGNLAESAQRGDAVTETAAIVALDGRRSTLQLAFIRSASGWEMQIDGEPVSWLSFTDGSQSSGMTLFHNGIVLDLASVTSHDQPTKLAINVS